MPAGRKEATAAGCDLGDVSDSVVGNLAGTGTLEVELEVRAGDGRGEAVGVIDGKETALQRCPSTCRERRCHSRREVKVDGVGVGEVCREGRGRNVGDMDVVAARRGVRPSRSTRLRELEVEVEPTRGIDGAGDDNARAIPRVDAAGPGDRPVEPAMASENGTCGEADLLRPDNRSVEDEFSALDNRVAGVGVGPF